MPNVYMVIAACGTLTSAVMHGQMAGLLLQGVVTSVQGIRSTSGQVY